MIPVGCRKSSTGFTLLELLAALAVLALLLAALSQGMRFGLLAVGMGNRLTDNTSDLQVVETTLRHLIEGMDPGIDPDPAPVAGAGNSLECITTMPGDGPTQHSQMLATLFVDNAHRLILRWRPYLRATPLLSPPAPADAELLSGVWRIELAYWGPSGGWVSMWRSQSLPKLVRVRLTFLANDPRHWPDIIAAPLLGRP